MPNVGCMIFKKKEIFNFNNTKIKNCKLQSETNLITVFSLDFLYEALVILDF
jgi:hypothetical protein